MTRVKHEAEDAKPTEAVTQRQPAVAAPVRAAAARRGRRGLVVAVLVTLLGGVIAYGGARMLTSQVPVLALARDVAAGAAVSDADLVVVDLPVDPNIEPVAAANRASVVGKVAQMPLLAGGILTAGQVGPSDGFGAGERMVALAVKLGQMPATGVSSGRRVLIVPTPKSGPAGAAPADSDAESIAATVAHVSAKDAASGVTVVDVRVADAQAEGLARLAATGDFAVVLLPPGK